MGNIVSNVILSGAGAAFLLFIVARILPNEKIRALGVSIGKTVSAFGARKVGKAFWEKVEDFLENSSGVLLEGIKEGLDADDAQPDDKPA